jgi:hypothetical protein
MWEAESRGRRHVGCRFGSGAGLFKRSGPARDRRRRSGSIKIEQDFNFLPSDRTILVPNSQLLFGFSFIPNQVYLFLSFLVHLCIILPTATISITCTCCLLGRKDGDGRTNLAWPGTIAQILLPAMLAKYTITARTGIQSSTPANAGV